MKTRHTRAALAALLSAFAVANTPAALQPGQTPASFDAEVVRKVHLDYLAYVPEAAAQSTDKKWPAILFLHGSGERGTNLLDVAKHGPPKILKDKKDFGFIVISPQCPPTQRGWDVEALTALSKQVLKDYPVDPDRFYLTGLSMGGYGSWALAAAQPGMFAAVAPICGGGSTADASKLKNLPIWVFHGGKDNTVPIAQSERMVDAISSLGGNIRFTIYPDAGHDSWTATYDNPELYEWFLQHKRK